MEWPKELLDIFEDPILDDVRPKEARLTSDDRRVKTLLEITEWCESHDGRLPQKDRRDLREKTLARNLIALRRDATESLKPYDRLNILTEE